MERRKKGRKERREKKKAMKQKEREGMSINIQEDFLVAEGNICNCQAT